jgi:precorrin-6B methylase 2
MLHLRRPGPLLEFQMPVAARRLLLCFMLAAAPALAQERFSPFVPSDQENVERMLKLVGLRDDDIVVDLGSGDGRIVLTAAQMNRKLRGFGVDIDEKLVAAANATAKSRGIADRVQFLHRNAYDADLREATVIAMWLWPEFQRMLRPIIIANARPGTRVITNLWDLGDWWPPDAEDIDGPRVAMWIVPARVEGYWNWDLAVGGQRFPYAAILEQRFQRVEGVVRSGKRRELLHDMKLRGEDISFSLGLTLDGVGFVRHAYTGKVRGDRIEGTVKITFPPDHQKTIELPWQATRGTTSAYLEPTGTDIPR